MGRAKTVRQVAPTVAPAEIRVPAVGGHLHPVDGVAIPLFCVLNR